MLNNSPYGDSDSMAKPKQFHLENTVPAEEVSWLRAEVRQADRQIKSGHYIKHEDMKAWLLSWGTDRELPPPKCACGSSEC
jgi:predicted transcriptional regulator